MTTNKPPELRISTDLEGRLRAAIEEDVRGGDITSEATIAPDARGRARMIAKQDGVVAGLTVARAVFRLVDKNTKCALKKKDGDSVRQGDLIMTVTGKMRSILTAERVALNFLQRLSGTATLTARYVNAVKGTKAGVYDTRKTTPLWRDLERHAVRCGGGFNHRYCLDDMVLIKDNHIDAAGSVGEATRLAVEWRRCGGVNRRRIKIMSETRDIGEVRQALEAGADFIMLDNMTASQIRRAVEIVNGRVPLEVSGGLTIRRCASLAKLGVERLSIGAVTHSAPALDISLKYQE